MIAQWILTLLMVPHDFVIVGVVLALAAWGGDMTHVQFLRIKKLTGKAIIEVAARHNHREILAEMGVTKDSHIDPTRTGLNHVLHGCNTAAGVAREAQTLMSEAGIKAMRKDAVRALEIIFSLSPHSPIDHNRFFGDAFQWSGQYFKAPVISAIVHNDEAAPHCHVLLLPLVGGRMIGSDLMGGRARLQAMQADFHVQVGQRHGLARQTAQKRHSATIRRQAIDSAFDVLKVNSGLNDDVLHVLLEPHANNESKGHVRRNHDQAMQVGKGAQAYRVCRH